MGQKQKSCKVSIEVLGEQKNKFVTTDRLSAYNVLVKEKRCLQQVCLTHLIRNSKGLAKHYKEAKYIYKRLKYIYRKAKEDKTPKERLIP